MTFGTVILSLYPDARTTVGTARPPAVGYRIMKDEAKSRANYKKSLELNPNNQNAKKALGIVK